MGPDPGPGRPKLCVYGISDFLISAWAQTEPRSLKPGTLNPEPLKPKPLNRKTVLM